MDAVAIDEVTKTFGRQAAVDDLSLRVPEGSVYGFIGPNGSGKSTTLRMIMRILHPDRGRIRVLGTDSHKAANDRIGYLPEERSCYKKMKVLDVLCFHAELKGLRKPRPTVETWLARMGLADAAGKRIEQCSKGMAQKVQFIATVVHHPVLVILDEPFSGLDPVNLNVIRDAILELNQAGTTVIFSTHDMAVAEQLCDFIFMIYQGKKVLDGTLQSIREGYPVCTVRVRVAGAAIAESQQLPGVSRIADLGNIQELTIDPSADTQELLGAVMRLGRVELFEVARPSLHDIFVRIAAPRPEELADA